MKIPTHMLKKPIDISRIVKILKKHNAFDTTIVPEEEINDDEPVGMA